MNKSQKIIKLTFFLLTFVIVVELVALSKIILSNKAVADTLILNATFKPEKFTELYLENHNKLPKETLVNNPYSFRFTIHNLEHQLMEYPYEIYIVDASGSARVDEDTGRVTLKHDQYKTITQTFTLMSQFTRAKVVVNLIDKNQSIHFWIGKEKE